MDVKMNRLNFFRQSEGVNRGFLMSTTNYVIWTYQEPKQEHPLM